jgi:hypothetical protein
MRYTVTTFRVRLEVCDVGERTGASEDVVRVARPTFAELDADKELFSPACAQQQEQDQRLQSNLDRNTDRDADSAGRRVRCGA